MDQAPTKDDLARFMWMTRQRIHGNWPDDGPLDMQPEMVRDWVTQEADAVLRFIFNMPE